MNRPPFILLVSLFLTFSTSPEAQNFPPRILTNQVGYETGKPKRAIIIANRSFPPLHFLLIDDSTGQTVDEGKAIYSGTVDHWKDWQFWTIDFSGFTRPGTYSLRSAGGMRSAPFVIGERVLEKATISDILYYFKGQRSAGANDRADRHLSVPTAAFNPGVGGQPAFVDVHGGWYDATGDYGKHLSHLSFSGYFNPQQIPFVVYSLLKSYELLARRPGTDFRQVMRRMLDEAMYGADYLVRVQARGGSFYRSIDAPGPGKFAKDRVISPEQQHYRIRTSKDASFGADQAVDDWRSYQSSFRSGGGMAIAALALASMSDVPGEYPASHYLGAAEDAFAFLQSNNAVMTNDGKNNIVDEYCALAAATELYKATRNEDYRNAAETYAGRLIGRLHSWKGYGNYWRADSVDRPFFHPADAGLPVVSLLYYCPYAREATRAAIKKAVRLSLGHELAITREVNNPFGYSRQLVQDTMGRRRSSFFFPHASEASPWWQGEDARIASLAAAARLAIPLYRGDSFSARGGGFADSLEVFALDQLNWILGLNPYDASMLQGTGRNNPAYGFFGTFEYTNAPGGIVNGITSGLDNETDIDFNLPYARTHKDNDWRWAEQWLPHASWFLLAVAAGQPLEELASGIDAEHINDHPTLAIGSPAPGFMLEGIDGKTYSLDSFRDAKVLVIVFMCNHCPTSQAYEQRLIRLTGDYAAKGVRVVAISPNSPAAVRIDELGYSDVGDSFQDMKTRAKAIGYNFPYLYDGETEIASRQYGPVATPQVFIFDQDRRLRYTGRIDDTEDPDKTAHRHDAREAIDAILGGQPIAVAVTKPFGCSIKWIEKNNWARLAAAHWVKEPVSLRSIGLDSLTILLHNDTKKLRLINFWATWCIPCVEEFPDLVSLNRMYRERGLEVVSVSLDKPDTATRGKALRFLEKQEASSPNFIYEEVDHNKLMNRIPAWPGGLPYSLLIDPGGKIVYAHEGAIDAEKLRKIIFDDPNMGRIYK